MSNEYQQHLDTASPFVGTHWHGCWKSHHLCAVAEAARLATEKELREKQFGISEHWRKLSESEHGRRTRAEEALRAIRDATHRDAVTLRALAHDALEAIK